MWLIRLRQSGVRATLSDGGKQLSIQGNAFRLLRRSSLRLSRLPETEPDVVLWLPSASRALANGLTRAGWSWVTDDGAVRLRLPDRLISLDPEPRTGAHVEPATSVTRAEAEVAVLGYLLERPGPHRQGSIALASGITQPRVSQILMNVTAEGLVIRTRDGWRMADPARLFDICVAAPERRFTEGWYHLDSAGRQVELCVAAAEASGAPIRVSGDWAADQVAPWRIPSLGVVHADTSLHLEASGFVPAGASEATLLARIGWLPAQWRVDPGVCATMAEAPVRWPLAPVHQIARDVLASGGPDAQQAVAHLRERFFDTLAEVDQ